MNYFQRNDIYNLTQLNILCPHICELEDEEPKMGDFQQRYSKIKLIITFSVMINDWLYLWNLLLIDCIHELQYNADWLHPVLK